MVLQNAAVFPVTMLVGLGIYHLEVGQLLWFGVFLAILFYIGFVVLPWQYPSLQPPAWSCSTCC